MPPSFSGLRYPVDRVLLQRTRLAYVHLRHLLSDAKRDRAARVYGYVGVWLPEEFLLLFLQEGELVNATRTADGRTFQPIALADALARVPSQAEFGEICFHEAEDEQLAMMYWSQLGAPVAWPAELGDPEVDAVLAYLHATLTDGTVELRRGDDLGYASVRFGRVTGGFFTNPAGTDPMQEMRRHLHGRADDRALRLFPVPRSLPCQAAPSLVQAYRELIDATVAQLEETGCVGASAMAEETRRALLAKHPPLAHFGRDRRSGDPHHDAGEVTVAVASLLRELVSSAVPSHAATAGPMLAALTRERRHSFQSAGLFETLPWTVAW